jgi:hypothetical protein
MTVDRRCRLGVKTLITNVFPHLVTVHQASYAELLVSVELRKNLAGFEILYDEQEGFVLLIR